MLWGGVDEQNCLNYFDTSPFSRDSHTAWSKIKTSFCKIYRNFTKSENHSNHLIARDGSVIGQTFSKRILQLTDTNCHSSVLVNNRTVCRNYGKIWERVDVIFYYASTRIYRQNFGVDIEVVVVGIVHKDGVKSFEFSAAKPEALKIKSRKKLSEGSEIDANVGTYYISATSSLKPLDEFLSCLPHEQTLELSVTDTYTRGVAVQLPKPEPC